MFKSADVIERHSAFKKIKKDELKLQKHVDFIAETLVLYDVAVMTLKRRDTVAAERQAAAAAITARAKTRKRSSANVNTVVGSAVAKQKKKKQKKK